MEQQVIEIGSDGFYLSLFRGFLRLENRASSVVQDIPLDRILSVVVSANEVTCSKNIINAVCAEGGTFIFCDRAYLPCSITLPYAGHWLISARVKQQIDAGAPLQKNLWQNIVRQKITNQAEILRYFFPTNPNLERLKRLAKETLSNDSRNNEGLAASIYFKALFGKHFVRDRLKNDVNILLNYAYIVLRAMVARAVAGNGLLPYIGIKHCNKTNTLPLVDDLIEPFRAVADKIVYEILNDLVDIDQIELTPALKRRLTGVITYPVQTDKGIVSLQEAVQDFVGSVVESYELKRVALRYPKLLL
jgi:CRISPR-associated protein Cas1